MSELSPGLRRRLAQLEARHAELERAMAEPSIALDRNRLRETGQEYASLQHLVNAAVELRTEETRLADARSLTDGDDADLRDLARQEETTSLARIATLTDRLRGLLVPVDPLDEKNVIIEIRGGEGGEEAALFAADLYRMYARYAERKRWRTEVLSQSQSEKGGFKEVIARVAGKAAYSRLKFESGVHRVQRVPSTEAQGRIHTSTATVAVLPEAEEVDIQIDERDLKVDVYRAAGKGGQGVNTTDSAVRITHLPTGIVATCQDERSQLKNRAKAMAVLRARLLALEVEKREASAQTTRRSQIARGERAEKVRTYNFPQDRLTDKRLERNLSGLERLLDGDLDELVDALTSQEAAMRLASVEEGPEA